MPTNTVKTLVSGIVIFRETTCDDTEAKKEDVQSGLMRAMDGKRCSNRAALHEEWAAKLGFPDYAVHGRWDSFEQCVYDLDWEPFIFACRILLIQKNAECVLEDEPNARAIFLDILRNAPAEFTSRRTEVQAATDDQKARLTIAFQAGAGGDEKLK